MTMSCRNLAFAALAISGLGVGASGTAAGSDTAAMSGAAATVTSGTGSSRTTSWPGVVVGAMAYVKARTASALEAPRTLPGMAVGGPNSARATANRGSYEVMLYACQTPMPVNNPGIGKGVCGDMAAIYGGFGGRRYRSAALARSGLAATSDSVSLAQARRDCTTVRRARILPRLEVTLYSGRYGNCLALWHEKEWTFGLVGDLQGGIGGDPTEPWRAVARAIVSYLGSHLLPGTEGVFSCDIAGDGLHTSLDWVRRNEIYSASTYHGYGIDLAIAMAPYPR